MLNLARVFRIQVFCPNNYNIIFIEEKFAEAAPKPMLYRPKAVYVGKYGGPQGCKYIPIEKRTKK